MNERIYELAESCTVDFVDGRGVSLSEIDVGKFAELIVQECVTICEQQRTKILQNPNDPSWTEHLAEVQTNIKQRFGVEK
jgi:hypothetical protein